jgi:type I restriction enzyme S subunit
MGEACLFPEGEQLCLGQRMMLYRPDPNKIRSSYIIHTIYSAVGQHYIELRRKGSTVGHLRVPEVYNFPCLLPPLEEQDEILAVLDRRAHASRRLRRKVRVSLDGLREYRSALITAAVTGQIDPATWLRSGEGERRLETLAEEVDA